MKVFRFILWLISVCGLVSSVLAQSRAIRGVVVDKERQPLIGVNILLMGTKVGTMTDHKGMFALRLSEEAISNAKLRFSYLGMKTHVQSIPQKGEMYIVLQEDINSLGEVTVTARPNINAIDVRARTGVVSQVDMKEIQQKPMIDLSMALQGATPGLMVVNRGELGQKPEVRLRGTSSLRMGDAANEPLYILDGKVISSDAFLTLNPLDIREIKVLKDAVATALYGIKAANGVLEISSRRGVAGPMSISLSSNFGLTLKGRPTTAMAGTEEKLELERLMKSTEAPGYIFSSDFINATSLSDLQQFYAVRFGLPMSGSKDEYLDYGADQLAELRKVNTNWFDELIRTNLYQSHSLSLRGGKSDLTYYVSGNYSHQGGQLEGNNVQRFTLLTSLDWQSRLGFISLGSTAGYARVNSPNSSSYSPLSLVYTLNPYESKTSPLLYSYPNRVYSDLMGQYRQWSDEMRYGLNLSANLKPIEGLQLDAIVGLDFMLSEGEQITPASAYSERVSGKSLIARGKISGDKHTNLNISSNLRATYSRLFAEKHQVDVSVNTDYYYTQARQLSVEGHGIGLQEYLAGVNKSLTGSYRSDFTGSGSRSAQFGVGLAVGYTYDKFIDLSFAYKADASSLLPKKQRWNMAWGLGVNLHFLDLFPSIRGSMLTDLNIKGGYGQTASLGGLNASLALPVFAYSGDSYYGQYFRQLGLVSMYNLDLRPEQVASIDLGLAVQLWKRYRLEGQVYRRDTHDALLTSTIPASNGFTSMMRNVGALRNEGVELSLSAKLIDHSSINLSVRTSLVYNRNVVLDLYGTEAIYSSSDALSPDYKVGESIGSVYGVYALGVSPLMGQLMYKTSDGEERSFSESLSSKDLIRLGSSTPPYSGTLSLSVSSGRFDVDMQFYYVFGGVKPYSFNYVRRSDNVHLSAISGQLSRTWFKEGDADKLYPSPQSGLEAAYNMSRVANSRMLAKSDYLRLSMLSLRYRLPERILKLLGGIVKYASFAVQASNLFTLTPYRGSSPESGNYDISVQPVVNMNININF